jgi:hypothetical protein
MLAPHSVLDSEGGTSDPRALRQACHKCVVLDERDTAASAPELRIGPPAAAFAEQAQGIREVATPAAPAATTTSGLVSSLHFGGELPPSVPSA